MKIQTLPREAGAEAASNLLKALASPHRFMIACRLSEGAEMVGALAAVFGVRESVVSQHLSVMRRLRVVYARREGQQVRYALQSQAAREVIKVLSKSICGFDAPQNRRN